MVFINGNIRMKVINIKLLFFVTILLSGFSLPVMSAQSAKADSAFNLGAESFSKKDYSSAIKAFEQAEANGLKTPALYYNLASSYYMAEQYGKAREYFLKVREFDEMQDLADYNLGLVALKQNDKKSAENFFSGVVKKSSDKKLVALAGSNLKDIKPRTKSLPAWTTKKWSAYLSASLGYDDNVNFAPLGISNEISSSFSELFASGDFLFSGDRKNGWLAEAYFYTIKYYDVDEPITDLYDEYEFGIGIKKNFQINRLWRAFLSLDASKINYAGEDYQTIAKISAEARKSLSSNERLNLRYSFEDIKSDNLLFDYLEGWRQKIRAEYRLYRKSDNSRIYYELELNDRNDLSITAGDFSYSPTRHVIRGRYTRLLSDKWHLTGDLAYRYSDYPTTASQDRQDNRVKVAAYADYRFTRDVKLRAKAEYTDNSSTEDIFTYNRLIYTLGINAYF
jgi:hypothetical protein